MADDRPSLEMPTFSLRRRTKAPADADAPATSGSPTAEPDPVLAEPPPARGRVSRGLPTVPVRGLPAAVLTGAVVGALALLLGWLAGTGCEAVRGTSACGGGPGLLVLMVVLVVLTWSGSVLLRVLGVPHPGSTALLAVGILAVLVLLFLLGSLDEGWALVAVPVVSALAHAASWWVTTAAAGDDTTDTPARTSSYDVR